MSLSNKNLQAILRNKKIRQELLASTTLSLEDYADFENLNEEKADEAYENIMNCLKAFATVTLHYPSPVEQYPDDAVLYGVRGFYFVELEDDIKYFSSKKEAIKFADSVSSNSWDLAEQLGLIE
jgi:hypothetical protein